MTPDEVMYHRLVREEMVRLKDTDDAYRTAYRAWWYHVGVCEQCNYDLPCTTCQADGTNSTVAHSCNCPLGPGVGSVLEGDLTEQLNRIKAQAIATVEEA